MFPIWSQRRKGQYRMHKVGSMTEVNSWVGIYQHLK